MTGRKLRGWPTVKANVTRAERALGQKLLDQLTAAVAKAATKTAPYRTGRLRESIEDHKVSAVHRRIIYPIGYASPQHVRKPWLTESLKVPRVTRVGL